MGDANFIRKSLFMLGGFLVWAAHFMAIYTFNALACARGFYRAHVFGFGIVPGVVVLATAIAIAAVLALLLSALRWRGAAQDSSDSKAADDFLRYSTIAIAALSLVAISWSALPALFVPPCG